MGCVFSAIGPEFDVDEFWRRYTFKPADGWRVVDNRELFRLAMRRSKVKVLHVWRKGVLLWSHKPRGIRHKKSGFVLDVSRTGFNDVPLQIRDATRFLKANQRVLRSLRRFPGVDSLNLDFGINRTRGTVVQCESFPSELLRHAGELGVDLTISFYAP